MSSQRRVPGGAGDVEPGTAEAKAPVLVVRFSGSGWLLAFHCGVGKFIHDHLKVDHPRLRFGGQSGGSLVSAALTAGMDVDCVYEASLSMYEPCKNNPFRMRKCLNEALDRLAPPDDAWVRSRHRLIVGMSRIEHLGRGKLAWKSTNVTEFRSRAYGLKVLEASCHLPVISGVRGIKVDGNRFFDGGVAELVPDITPEQIGLNSDPAKGPVDPVFSIDICSWGNLGEGYHICPGFDVPVGWFFFPHNPGVLNKLFRLGYARAAECFTKIDPRVTADLWRPGMELGMGALAGICAQVDDLIEFLRGADPFCCIDTMLSSRKKYSKPQLERLERLHIKQMRVPETADVLPMAAQAQLRTFALPPYVAGDACSVYSKADVSSLLAVTKSTKLAVTEGPPHVRAPTEAPQQGQQGTSADNEARAATTHSAGDGVSSSAAAPLSGPSRSEAQPEQQERCGQDQDADGRSLPRSRGDDSSGRDATAAGCSSAASSTSGGKPRSSGSSDAGSDAAAAAAVMPAGGAAAETPREGSVLVIAEQQLLSKGPSAVALISDGGSGTDVDGCVCPRHALRPLPPLTPSIWLKDDEQRQQSLASMASAEARSRLPSAAGRGNKVVPLPPLMPPVSVSLAPEVAGSGPGA